MIYRHGAVEGDVLDGSVVAARNAAHARIAIGVRHVARHAAVLYLTVRFVQSADAAQVGVFRGMIMVAFHVGTHPAVLYRAIVVTSDAAHHSCIAHLYLSVQVEVRHLANPTNRLEEPLVVVRGVFYFDADGVAVAVERANIARATHRFP